MEILHRLTTVFVAKFIDHLADSHFKLTIERIHLAPVICRHGVLANRQRMMVNDGVVVGNDNRTGRSKRAQFLVHCMQCAVGIRFIEHHAHDSRHVSKPRLDGG